MLLLPTPMMSLWAYTLVLFSLQPLLSSGFPLDPMKTTDQLQAIGKRTPGDGRGPSRATGDYISSFFAGNQITILPSTDTYDVHSGSWGDMAIPSQVGGINTVNNILLFAFSGYGWWIGQVSPKVYDLIVSATRPFNADLYGGFHSKVLDPESDDPSAPSLGLTLNQWKMYQKAVWMGAMDDREPTVADIDGLKLFVWAPLDKGVKASEINWNDLAANDGKYYNERFLHVLKNEMSYLTGGGVSIVTVPLKWTSDKKTKSVAFKYLIRLIKDGVLVGRGISANTGLVPYRLDFGHYYAGIGRATVESCG